MTSLTYIYVQEDIRSVLIILERIQKIFDLDPIFRTQTYNPSQESSPLPNNPNNIVTSTTKIKKYQNKEVTC